MATALVARPTTSEGTLQLELRTALFSFSAEILFVRLLV